ncbi:MAG: 7-cyano-7-deazaguanine synthase QueC [Methanothrix sp.]|uniref:7-cyano-7-deazaguanine synthase QueC n=1 Tax=Methanothrix sp. TaxID=90426 RepID=UPI003BAF3C09
MKAVLIYSGGLDSSTLLYRLLADGYQVDALTFNYAQRHKKEIECARVITSRLDITHHIIDLSSLAAFLGQSALLGKGEVPRGLYTEEAARQTVVPNRNMIMLSVAAGYAEAQRIPELFYAAHRNDLTVYPDCRPEFVDALKPAIRLGTAWHPVQLRAPFLDMTKAEIVRMGLELQVPYELTWSCYLGMDKPCRSCPTCIEREEAFALCGCRDPLVEMDGA